ncbi:MAG: hypothetical protein L3J65_03665 [Robiginitomaculum sp.]|nr:hypothetical protein [Robiginitomaculum sp.]
MQTDFMVRRRGCYANRRYGEARRLWANGGLLMFFGDMCFYLRPVSGADFIADLLMNTVGTSRLLLAVG